MLGMGLSDFSRQIAHPRTPHVGPGSQEKAAPVPVPENFQTQSVYEQAEVVRDNVHLECLPTKIRRHILSMLKYEELKALVHASSVYHQQYVLDRHYILFQCLKATLGGNIIDACAVFQSGLAGFLETRNQEKIIQFLESYRTHHHPSHSLDTLTLDQLISMATFHFTIIKPLVWYYPGWAMDNLSREIKDPPSHGLLSIIEETRLVRSLYRFQLYCNLFGVGRYPFRQRLLKFSSVDFLRLFLNTYEPWEAEELVCIHTFVAKNFDKIFDGIAWDVHEDNPKFNVQDRPPTPKGAFDLEGQFFSISTLGSFIYCLSTTIDGLINKI